MNTSDSSAGSAPGTPPGEPPHPPVGAPDKVDEFFDSIRRTGIVRAHDRWVAGVASGIALRLGIDALLVRVALVVLVVIGSGAGLVLYAIGWALLPEQTDGRIHLHEAIRGRFDSALVGAGIVFLVGITSGAGIGWWDGAPWLGGFFWVVLTVFAIYVLVTVRNERTGRTGAPAPGTGPYPTATYPPMQHPAAPTAPVAPTAAGAFSAGGTYPSTSTPSGPVTGAGPNLQKAPAPGAPRPTAPFTGSVPPPVPSAPWTPPAPPPAPRPSRSAGVTYVSSVLGLSLLAFAVFLLADRYGSFAHNPWLTAVGVSIVLTGLAIVLAGLRGRSSGGLGFLAIVAILVGAPAASWSSSDWFEDGVSGSPISDSTYEPTSVESAEDGYAFGLGDLTLDLTSLDLPDDPADLPVRIPIELGAGNVTVILPEDTAASARVTVGAGQVHWDVDGDEDSRGGVGTSGAEFATQDVTEGATPVIHLIIEAGAGEIHIEEES